MKNQRMKTNQSTGFSTLLVILTVVMLIGCFAVTTFAANGNVAVDLGADLNIGLTMGSDGIYCKEYDGTTSANVTAKAANVTVVSAQFDSADVATATKVVIQLTKDGEKYEEVSLGDGPIDASFKAIDKIVNPEAHTFKTYTIHSISEGKDTLGDVTVRLASGGRTYTGKGLSTDIIEASILAYINAINKMQYAAEQARAREE